MYTREVLEKLLENISEKEIKESFRKINEAYRDKSARDGELEIRDEKDAIVYSLYRMPATSSVISKVLDGLLEEDCNFMANSVLDIGSGTGASLLSMNSILSNDCKVTLMEEQSAMISSSLKLQKLLKNDYDEKWDIDNLKGNFLEYKFEKENHFDLILSSYMVNELNESEINNFADKVDELSFKYLVIIVPGTPHHYRKLNTLRENLINKGMFIVSPCRFTGKCHLQVDNWCHFYRRVERSSLMRRIKDGELSYEDEKFSYLILTKEKAEDKSGIRILRHPEIRKGFIKISGCGRNGIKEYIFTKGKNKELYKKVKDCSWGSLIEEVIGDD